MAKKKTGAPRMGQLGYKAVQVWLKPLEYRLVSRAAAKASRSLTSFVRVAAVRVAQEDCDRE